MMAALFLAVIYKNLLDDAKSVWLSRLKNEVDRGMLAESKRQAAEEHAADLEARNLAVSKSIEGNALPWFPKNDMLEHRFEADAIDKQDNPEISWDSIPGLGGTQ